MRPTFLSLVFVLDDAADRADLVRGLPELHRHVQTAYRDYEYIVINNRPDWPVAADFKELPTDFLPHLYLINLSSRTDRNHAWLAGLDRANGDYTIPLDARLTNRPTLIDQLFDRAQEGYDIVYLRATSGRGRSFGWLHGVFHRILRRYSKLDVDPLAHHSRIISRRALNALLRLRESLPYLKAAYSLVGFRAAALPLDEPLSEVPDFRDRFQAGLRTISGYTTFPRALMGWILVGSLLFLLAVVTNAVMVRFLGHDLFWQPVRAASGWTYLVVLIGVFFATVSLQLYLVSIYLANMYEEIKRRPLYTIESIVRF